MINRTPFVGHSISITQTRASGFTAKSRAWGWRAASVGGVGCGQEGEEEEEESWMKGKRGRRRSRHVMTCDGRSGV